MKRNSTDMTPNEMRNRGRELIKLAAQKEQEIRNSQLLQIGKIFDREIRANWSTPWEQLEVELRAILGCTITPPAWGFTWGVQGGGDAPLAGSNSQEE